jgi:LPXTG-motif cell wall-anchored protein
MATDGGAESLLISLGSSEHSYNVTGLMANHTCTFHLSAVNAIGEGPKCPGVTLTLPNSNTPDKDVVDSETGSTQTVGLTLGGAAVALVATMGCFMVWYRKKN